jgi:hypothetical protein
VKKNFKHLVTDFKAVSTRICTLRIKGKFFNYTITNVHAPTEVSAEEEKEASMTFYRKYMKRVHHITLKFS